MIATTVVDATVVMTVAVPVGIDVHPVVFVVATGTVTGVARFLVLGGHGVRSRIMATAWGMTGEAPDNAFTAVSSGFRRGVHR
jgi:hypothetical protein